MIWDRDYPARPAPGVRAWLRAIVAVVATAAWVIVVLTAINDLAGGGLR
jgi:hypothetical protein